jgi:ABC-type polysaccharide/polyol phosphate transport system ATPase subunit
MTSVVSLRGVGKRYRISSSRSAWIKDLLRPGKASSTHEFWALEDVDLEIEQGITLGVVGRNGAGKSTMLQIISGVTQPTTGAVEVNGRLTAIFGLGSGFNPEFTGRENVMLNGLILGIDYREMLDRFDEIADFADIGEFMDQPIKTYSSGMKSRLGFAVAVTVNPEILVIDEALSAGDAAFKKKALQRMYDLRDSGTTVLFVSHSLGMIKRFCTDAVLLHKGHIVSSGNPEDVVDEYRELLENSGEKKDTEPSERDRQLDDALDHEDEEDMPDFAGKARNAKPAEVVRVELLDKDRRPLERLPSDDDLIVRARVRYPEPFEESTLSVALRDHSGALLFATSTDLEGSPLGSRTAGERVTVDFALVMPLPPGGYNARAILSVPDGGPLARSEEEVFEMTAGKNGRDTVSPSATVEIHEEDHEEQGFA